MNDPRQDPKLQALYQKIVRSQQIAGAALASVFTSVGSMLIQLRSHERGVEGHDDITPHIKEALLACVTDNHMELLSVLTGAEDEFEKARPEQFVELGQRWTDRLGQIPYSDKLDEIGARYIKAFPNDPLAQFLLGSMGDLIGDGITNMLPTIVNLILVGVEGRQARIVDSQQGCVLDQIEQSARANLKAIAYSAVDHLFEQACPVLDNLASQETARFRYLVAEGTSQLDAAIQVRSEFKDKITRALADIQPPEQDQQSGTEHCSV